MSKGPGKWQRMILAELADREAFHLRALLGRKCTKAQYNALLRAALNLETAGKINIAHFYWGARPGTGKSIVHRIGTTVSGGTRNKIEQEDRDRWDKCWPSSIRERSKHLTIEAEFSG
jgi:hypothetical protein